MHSMLQLARTLRNVALAYVICASPAVAEDAGLTPLKVGIPYPTTDVLPIYAALAKGYFNDEHLAVETVSLATGDKIAFALVGGSIEIANYTPDWFIRAAEKGAKLKIILGEGSDLIFSMIAADDIKNYADLHGKRIGVSTLKAADAYLVKKMLAAHGLGEDDYILIPAGSSPERAAALKAGSLSATLLAPPVDERVIGEGGVTRFDRSSDILSHYAWGGEAVMEDWADAHKAALVDYIRAWVRGLEWLRDPKNTEEGVAILAQNLKLPDQFARSTFDLYYGPKATVPPNGKIDLAGYQALLKDMTDQGQIGPPVPPAQKYLDTSYWEEAQKEKSASR
jgi:ABC-type nitrate/sulfonate/bicarbonate transport system substrate-binding protein